MAAGLNDTQCVFFPLYAIFDLASDTVLDLGNVASCCGLDAAKMVEFAYTRPERAEYAQ
jgi:hypothetical protein